jgi:hypothetical protein
MDVTANGDVERNKQEILELEKPLTKLKKSEPNVQ